MLLAIQRVLNKPVGCKQYLLIAHLLLLFCLSLLCIFHAYYFYPWYFPLDDAYIVLHSAQVLHLGYDPNYIGAPALSGNTSPVHLFLTAIFLFFLSPIHALWLTSWIAIFLYAWGILALCICYRLTVFQVLLVFIIVFLAGDNIFQLLNGVETGLAMAGVVWTIVFASLPLTKTYRFLLASLLGLLPFIRPELIILSLVLFVYQLNRYWQFSEHSLAKTLHLALQDSFFIILVALPWLLWTWDETGVIYPLTALAKKTFFAIEFSRPFSRLNLFSLVLFDFFFCVGFLLPSLVFLLVFSSLGRTLFVFITLFLVAYYINVPNIVLQNNVRYLYPLMPILIYAVVVNLTWKEMQNFINGVLILTAIQAFVFLPYNGKAYLLSVKNAGVIFPAYTEWCNKHIPKNETIAIQDAGYIAFATTFHLNDFVGLKTPSNITYHEKLTYLSHGKLRVNAISEILKKNHIHYLIVTEEWDRDAEITKGLRELGWKVTLLHKSYTYLIYYLSGFS